MGLYQQYEASDTAVVTFGDDFWVRIRSPHHPKMKRLVEHQLKKYRSHLKGEAIPLEVSRQMDVETCVAMVEEWGGEGAVDREGKPLACDVATVERVTRELDWFRQDLLTAYRERMTFLTRSLVDLGKDSAGSSGPTSASPAAAS